MKYLALNKNRVIHGIKTALACLISFIVTKSTHLPVDQWLIITVLIVMCAQANVGSMIQKSYLRFLGTLSGSLLAVATLLIFGVNPIATATVITLSAIVFSYLATSQSNVSEAATLGAVTTTIILVGQNPTIMTALGRFLEISGGILIAALVSQFILPIRARDSLRRKQTQTLRQLRAYYLATLLTDQNTHQQNTYHEIDEEIIKSLMAQRKLATDASREPYAQKNLLVIHFSKILWCEREIQRAITFMHHVYKVSPESKVIFSGMNVLQEFHDKICNVFEKLAVKIATKSPDTIIVDIPSVQAIKNAIQANMSHLTSDDITYTHAFVFCAEILIARLCDISELIR